MKRGSAESATITAITKMEFGIKIIDIEQLEKIVEKYSYVYFGNECCERKIPEMSFAEKVFEHCKKTGKTPVLMTPFMTDYGVKLIKKLISELYKIMPDFEITINDFGMLNILEEFPKVRINLGRMLVKMKKGPEIISKALNENSELFKTNSLNPPFIEFMKKNRVERFETDIPLQGIDLPEKEKVTLYLGNVLISVTRRCPFIDSAKKEFSYAVKACSKECLNYCFVKNTKFHEELIYMMGNAEFLKREKEIGEELKGRFDRVVVFPSMTDNL